MLLRGGFRLFVAHASPKRSAVKTVRSPIGAFTWPVRGGAARRHHHPPGAPAVFCGHEDVSGRPPGLDIDGVGVRSDEDARVVTRPNGCPVVGRRRLPVTEPVRILVGPGPLSSPKVHTVEPSTLRSSMDEVGSLALVHSRPPSLPLVGMCRRADPLLAVFVLRHVPRGRSPSGTGDTQTGTGAFDPAGRGSRGGALTKLHSSIEGREPIRPE